MINIYVFTQNVKLKSFGKFVEKGEKNIFVTTHMLFDYEKNYLCSLFRDCKFYKFADFMNDKENEECDFDAYSEKISVEEYYDRIKRLKNEKIVKKVLELYPDANKYLCASDLGIDEHVWLNANFRKIRMEYYYNCSTNEKDIKAKIKNNLKRSKFIRKLNTIIKQRKWLSNITEEIYVAFDGTKKYVFVGKMDRVSYRMDLKWEKSKEERERLRKGKFETADKCQYLSSLHENSKCLVPDSYKYDVRYIQDGYLPPNYSSRYLRYKPKNVSYYTWDALGKRIFEYHSISAEIMPFRKKIFMPEANFKKQVKNILVATSGPGDWTAQKNRSDEDLMLQTFVEVAKRFPEINIIYRCHPTWIHPVHAGVNSINRAREYIAMTGLKNIHISSNIPEEHLDSFILSFPRSSLEEDLKDADIVFGEHSVSLLDGAFKKIPFASVNVTNRRDLFCGITEMGFPHCSGAEDIIKLINEYGTDSFKLKYSRAIKKYNEMTNEDD